MPQNLNNPSFAEPNCPCPFGPSSGAQAVGKGAARMLPRGAFTLAILLQASLAIGGLTTWKPVVLQGSQLRSLLHGELLMLGFSVSQATVSRYLLALGRRPAQSWRTFLRNQASAFGQYSEERSKGYAHLHGQSCWATRSRSAAAQITTGQQQPTLSVRRINLRSAQCDRGVTHRAAAVSGGSSRAPYDRSGVALPIRSPQRQAHASP